jgi:hypothetical protein
MITVPKIQLALKREYVGSSIVLAPNIFLYFHFESDLIRVTKSGYAIEYEIKLSKSDFRADFKKSTYKTHGIDPATRQIIYSTKTKHEWLTEGAGPTEFYYVFPENMVNASDVPEWAGIIEVLEISSNRVQLFKKRTASRLNKNKLSPEKVNDIFISCYYRFWAACEARNTNQILML